jgi:homoserine kinase type II
MAVFTPVSEPVLQALLAQYDLGTLVDHQGIASGIENTNYFVTTTQGRFVLTLFEKLTAKQLPFYLDLMHHLAAKGVACASPMPTKAGALFTTCENKPAALCTRLAGRDVNLPTTEHCRLVGQTLAQAHLAVADFSPNQPNLRGLSWWQETAPMVMPHLGDQDQDLLTQELQAQTNFAASPLALQLPRGAVHADLFRDNVLFDGSDEEPVLGGFIDFYFAGVDALVFDLAVTLNDWCIDHTEADSGQWNRPRYEALMAGYAQIRPLSAVENQALPMMLRAGALRFWISRLYDWHLPRQASMLKPKDPTHFERILRNRRSEQ